MSTKSSQNPNQKSSQQLISYPKCMIEGHNQLELKFIDRRELGNIKHVYCLMCIQNFLPNEVSTFIELPSVFDELVNLSDRYKDKLEPIVEDFYQKHQEISENDFKSMFEELTFRTEDFKKTLDNFQSHIAVLCTNFERLFQKRLEAIFYESLIDIDAGLSSSKKAFEILRMKVRSYSTNLSAYFNGDQDLPRYCENINIMLRDLDALKKSDLPQQMTNLINKVPVTSHIVDKFRTSCTFDTDILHITDSVVACLTQKLKHMQDDLNMAIIKLNQGYKDAKSRQSEPTKPKHDIETESTRPSQNDNIPEELSPTNKESLTEPLLGNNKYDYGEEKKEPMNKVNESIEREEKDEREEENEEENKRIVTEFINEELNDFPIQQDINEKGNEEINPTEKYKIASPDRTESNKEDGTEQLKKFAASLVLKAERKARGEEYNGGNIHNGKDRNDLRKELSGGSGQKEEKNRISHDHLRVSKKITKSKRLVKQREPEQKMRYLDGQKKQLLKEKLSIKDTWGDLKLFGEIGKDQHLPQEENNPEKASTQE